MATRECADLRKKSDLIPCTSTAQPDFKGKFSSAQKKNQTGGQTERRTKSREKACSTSYLLRFSLDDATSVTSEDASERRRHHHRRQHKSMQSKFARLMVMMTMMLVLGIITFTKFNQDFHSERVPYANATTD